MIKIDKSWVYLLLLPVLIYLGIFIVYPLVEVIVLAFSSEEEAFFSLASFKAVLSDEIFQKAFLNTLLLTGVIIPTQVILAVLLALFVNTRFKGYMFIIYIIAVPLALSDISAALMSYNMFAPTGYLNKILMKLGFIDSPLYFFGFTYINREFWVIALTEIWRATPLVFVVVLAGLQMIGKEYFEAADVFGFSRLQKFFYITLPLLKPSIQSALLLRTLFAFQIFGVVWLLAGRDIPILAGETFYQQAELNDFHKAAVYGVIIAFISVILSWIYLTFLKSKQEEV